MRREFLRLKRFKRPWWEREMPFGLIADFPPRTLIHRELIVMLAQAVMKEGLLN